MAPSLSVVLPVGAQPDRAQRVLDALGEQTAAGELEVLVVDHGGGQAVTPAAAVATRVLRNFDGSWGGGRALAVREARARWVAFTEDHCTPERGWAAALIGAIRRTDWAAIGYAFRCANPGSYRTRAAFIAEYGRWAVPVASGTTRYLPGTNVAYDRHAILALDADLAAAMEIDLVLHGLLLAAGSRFGIESGAIVRHQEFERFGDLSRASFSYARAVASRRAQLGEWSRARRLAYAVGAPLGAPFVNLARLALSLRGRPALWPRLIAALPVIAGNYSVAALGEATGYFKRELPAGQLVRWELDVPRSS